MRKEAKLFAIVLLATLAWTATPKQNAAKRLQDVGEVLQ
jgi:hypothetical protein